MLLKKLFPAEYDCGRQGKEEKQKRVPAGTLFYANPSGQDRPAANRKEMPQANHSADKKSGRGTGGKMRLFVGKGLASAGRKLRKILIELHHLLQKINAVQKICEFIEILLCHGNLLFPGVPLFVRTFQKKDKIVGYSHNTPLQIYNDGVRVKKCFSSIHKKFRKIILKTAYRYEILPTDPLALSFVGIGVRGALSFIIHYVAARKQVFLSNEQINRYCSRAGIF